MSLGKWGQLAPITRAEICIRGKFILRKSKKDTSLGVVIEYSPMSGFLYTATYSWGTKSFWVYITLNSHPTSMLAGTLRGELLCSDRGPFICPGHPFVAHEKLSAFSSLTVTHLEILSHHIRFLIFVMPTLILFFRFHSIHRPRVWFAECHLVLFKATWRR